MIGPGEEVEVTAAGGGRNPEVEMRWLFLVFGAAACSGGPVGDGDGVLDDAEVPQIGWVAELEGTAHDVAGTVTVVDESTLRIDNFTYDGGGINARFFLLVDGADFNRDLELTDNLVGDAFDNEELILNLPPEATLDSFDLISLWCVPVGVSFGMGTFGPPSE